jgi:alanine racemase
MSECSDHCFHNKVMATSPFRSWVEVSRSEIAGNYKAIKQVVGDGVAVMPVVKADAYRHGAVEVSRVLVENGAQWLAVSNVEEGVALRAAGISVRILVTADFLPFGRAALCEHGLTPVIHDLGQLTDLNNLGVTRGERVPFHLKIDTGMSRLGTRASASDIAATLNANPCVHLEGLMTHFASVSDFTTIQTDEQAARFFEMVEELRKVGITAPYMHLSSTGGIAYRRSQTWGNMVRPGLGIYGYVSTMRGTGPLNQLAVRPVMSWKAAVLAVKEIPKDALVGYEATFQAPETMRIAILAVGYADGIPHRLSNQGRVLVGGKLARIVGAVSMDLTTIDVTDCPEVEIGQAVTILGSEGGSTISAQDLACQAGTIAYGVLCGISSRVKRVYVD